MARSARGRPSGTRSSKAPYCPDEGEIIWLDFHPQRGREQSGRRPAIVLSPRRYNRLANLCVVCPITSHAKNYPFEVVIPEGGPIGSGVVLADQVKSVSWAERKSAFAGPAPAAVLLDVKAKLRALLQIA